MRGHDEAAAFSLSLLMFLTILLWSRALFRGVPDKEFLDVIVEMMMVIGHDLD